MSESVAGAVCPGCSFKEQTIALMLQKLYQLKSTLTAQLSLGESGNQKAILQEFAAFRASSLKRQEHEQQRIVRLTESLQDCRTKLFHANKVNQQLAAQLELKTNSLQFLWKNYQNQRTKVEQLAFRSKSQHCKQNLTDRESPPEKTMSLRFNQTTVPERMSFRYNQSTVTERLKPVLKPSRFIFQDK